MKKRKRFPGEYLVESLPGQEEGDSVNYAAANIDRILVSGRGTLRTLEEVREISLAVVQRGVEGAAEILGRFKMQPILGSAEIGGKENGNTRTVTIGYCLFGSILI